MMRLMGRTGLVTMMRAALAAVLAVGAAATATAAGSDGPEPTAKPLTTAALATLKAEQDPAPAAPAAGGQDAAGNPVVEFFKQVYVDGLVDVYYMWAFNEEAPQLHAFDVKHNAFTLNYAEVGIG